MRFRTRRHYNGNTWAGQLFTIEKPSKVWPKLGGKAFRVFIFWRQRNPYVRLPIEIQWRTDEDSDKRGWTFPPRKKMN